MVPTEAHPSRNERLQRLLDARGRMFMVPMDHGASLGPVPGITDPVAALEPLAEWATCTTLHKGFVPRVRDAVGDRMGVLMHLSASTDRAPDPDDKRIVGTVAEAVALGADGVSVHLNLGSPTEADQLEAVGQVATDCNLHRMPLVAMVYPRGPKILDPFEPALVAHAARLGAELGADVVKVPYTGDPDTFRPVVQGAGIPVVVAGGPKTNDFAAFLAAMQGAAEAGAAGISVGRNVFQSEDPAAALQAIIERFP